MRHLFILFLCLFLSLAVTMSSHARSQEKDRKTPLAPEARDRVRSAVDSVGLISVRDADGQLRPRGSGVVVRQDGIVVTNYHVVTQGKPEHLYDDLWFTVVNQRYHLSLLRSDKPHDLVLMRMMGDSGPASTVKSIELDRKSVV